MFKRLTIFTPTYNRSYILSNLYESLTRQDCKDFEWVIVDDGSNDNTRELVESFKKQNKINIRYYYQLNSGKSQAHNLGVEKTKTELFVCVDSDDFLLDGAVREILTSWDSIQDETVIGIVANRIFPDNSKITDVKEELIQNTSTLRHAYYSGLLSGDTCLVYSSVYMKKVRFPSFQNEKFVPESYLYDQLDQLGKMYFCNKDIYVTKYLVDGYTKNMSKLIYDNPKGYLCYIEQRISLDENCKMKIGNIIRYISVAIISSNQLIEKNNKLLSIICIPAGYYLYRKRFAKFKLMKEGK